MWSEEEEGRLVYLPQVNAINLHKYNIPPYKEILRGGRVVQRVGKGGPWIFQGVI